MARLCADWSRLIWPRPVGWLCCRVTMHWNVGLPVCCVNSELCADSQCESLLTATATARFLKVSQRWSVESVVCWRNVSDSQSASVVSDMVARRPGFPASSSRMELSSKKECGLYGVRRRRRERVSNECECRVGRSSSSSSRKQSSVSKLDGGKEGLRTRVAGGEGARRTYAGMVALSAFHFTSIISAGAQCESATFVTEARAPIRERGGVFSGNYTPNAWGVWDNTISR